MGKKTLYLLMSQALLNLNCKKAYLKFKWKSKLNFYETINDTIYWYKNYKKDGVKNITFKQIKNYLHKI